MRGLGLRMLLRFGPLGRVPVQTVLAADPASRRRFRRGKVVSERVTITTVALQTFHVVGHGVTNELEMFHFVRPLGGDAGIPLSDDPDAPGRAVGEERGVPVARAPPLGLETWIRVG